MQWSIFGAWLSILIGAFCGDAFAPVALTRTHACSHLHLRGCIKHEANEKRKCQPGGERFSRSMAEVSAENEGKLRPPHHTAMPRHLRLHFVPLPHLLLMQRIHQGAYFGRQGRGDGVGGFWGRDLRRLFEIHDLFSAHAA